MERIYVISRYAGKNRREVKFNTKVAEHYCRMIAEAGAQPVAPHLFYTRFIDDNDPQQRQAGLDFGLRDLETCDRFIMIVIDGIISDGMRGELKHLVEHGGPDRGGIVYLTRKEAKKEIKGGETDGNGRDQHRPGGRLRCRIQQLFKKV